jgi:uncharacterized protein (DUF58 family)
MKDLLPARLLKRLERLELQARGPATGVTFGRGRSRGRGTGTEFVDVRDYEYGDDPKRIDWSLFARLDRLIVRMYNEEREHDVHILLDISRSMAEPDPEKMERATQIAAALGYVALNQLDRVAVWPVADGRSDGLSGLVKPLPLAGGKRRIPQLFRYLSELHNEGVSDLAQAVQAFIRMAPARGVAVVISDFYDLPGDGHDGAVQGLRRLAQSGFVVHAIQVTGQELTDSPDGQAALVDVETGGRLQARVDRGLRRRVDELLEQQRRQLAEVTLKRGGSFVWAPVERPLEDLLLHDLRRRGALR